MFLSLRRMQLAQLVLRERALSRGTPALSAEPAWLAQLLDESQDVALSSAGLQQVDVL